VTIAVSGHISPSCGISGAPKIVELGRIDRPGSVDLALTLSCNAPFRYSLTSKNGGLRHTEIVKSPAPFTALIPYRMRFSFPTERGNIIDMCSSGDMAVSVPVCAANNRVDAVAIGAKASLSISWNFPDQPPLAGVYADTLTLTLGVNP
jgi:hypothetical protein